MNSLKWLYPGMGIKRWLLLFTIGGVLFTLGLALTFNYKLLDSIEESLFRAIYLWRGSYDYTFSMLAGVGIVVVGIILMFWATTKVIRSVITALLPNSSAKVVDMIYDKRRLDRGPAVTVIGGGHGLAVLLRGIKEITGNATAVVTVADDGGSSGRLREDLGIVPPGDLRNCLVALADTEPLMEKLFQYRFEGAGDLSGHSFGNLFLAAMTEVTGDIEKALQESSKVLAVKGRVLPASTEPLRLDAVMVDGSVVEGESHIPEAGKRIRYVKLHPEHVKPVPAAIDAILSADAIILGPGSLYTSIMPNLLVDGMAEALRKSQAVKIYICNVMTQPGETDGYTASMHAKAIIDHAGREAIDFMLVNSSQLSPALINKYAQEGSYPVIVDESNINGMGIGFLKADIISQTDAIRHDPDKLSRTIMSMIYKFKLNS